MHVKLIQFFRRIQMKLETAGCSPVQGAGVFVRV